MKNNWISVGILWALSKGNVQNCDQNLALNLNWTTFIIDTLIIDNPLLTTLTTFYNIVHVQSSAKPMKEQYIRPQYHKMSPI